MDIVGLVLQGLTAVAIIFAGWQLLFHSRQMHREFELIYVQRYWELMDRRSVAFALTRDAQESDQVVIRAYLQLCEDEADLRALGRITDNSWRFWSEAIVMQASVPAYRAQLERFDGEFPRVNDLIDSGGTRDPLRHRWVWRKFHGL